MNKHIIISTLTAAYFFICAAGCKKEAALSASEPELGFEFPQGNSASDQRIVDFYNKYGKYILYDYTDIDFRYNITDYIMFTAEIADPAYLGVALDSLDSRFFNNYSEEALKILLPQKFLLASRIRAVTGIYRTLGPADTLPDLINSAHAIGQLSFGHVHSRITTLSPAEWKVITSDLHSNCWQQAIAAKKVTVPYSFHNGLNYSEVFPWEYLTYGILEFDGAGVGTSLASDFGTYVKYITSHTKEELESTILDPVNDPAGKRRKKYDIVIEFCKSTFGLDLQAIGDRP